MGEQNTPAKKQLLRLIRRLESLKNNSSSYASMLAEIGIAGVGAVGTGAFAATVGSSVASVPILTALTGVGIAVSAPISLVAGAAALGGTATYGLVKAVVDGRTEALERREAEQQKGDLSAILQSRTEKAKSKAPDFTQQDQVEFILLLKTPLILDLLTATEAYELISLTRDSISSLVEAYQQLSKIIEASQDAELKTHNTDEYKAQSSTVEQNQAEETEQSEYQKMLARLLGDKEKVERLIQYEEKLYPNKTRLFHMKSAMERMDRDNI